MERGTKIDEIMYSEDALELSGNGGVNPGVSPPEPPLAGVVVVVFGVVGLFEVCVVGVIVPPAVLQVWIILVISDNYWLD